MTRPSLATRFGDWGRRNSMTISVSLLIGLFVVIYFSPLIFVTIPAGHRGVMWWRFLGGTATEWSYGEGMKVIPPWDKIYVYDTRLQQITLSVDALTSDGLSVNLDVAARFRLREGSVGELHQRVGPDFLETLVIPDISNQIRNEVARYAPDALYSRTREAIESNISRNADESISDISGKGRAYSYIEIEDILIRGVRLPDVVAEAVSKKNVERHQMEQYQYILQRERMESERKQIEAQGIRAFQDTVSAGISPNYLRWKGIDATLKLAESTNAKMVVIGKTDGLPLILGDWWNDADPAGLGPMLGPGAGSQAPPPTGTEPSAFAPNGDPILPAAPPSGGSAPANPPARPGAGPLTDPVTGAPRGGAFLPDSTGGPQIGPPNQPGDDSLYFRERTGMSREGRRGSSDANGRQALGNEAVTLGGGLGAGYDAGEAPSGDAGGTAAGTTAVPRR